jgi:hypothetical protein
MTPTELESFVYKFRNLWLTGQEAHLHVNARHHQAWVTLSVGLGCPPPPPQHQPPRLSRNGPSRQRRRARRLAAREAATTEEVEAAIAENDEAVQNQIIKIPSLSADAAVQAVAPAPTAVQAALPPQAVHQPPHCVPAGQAGRPGHRHHVRDVFCPDQDYQPQPAVQATPSLPRVIPKQDQGLTLSQFQELVQTIGKTQLSKKNSPR